MFTDEPEVLTWMIALAPRPRRPEPTGRHWWRELVTDAWRAADHAWWLHREGRRDRLRNRKWPSSPSRTLVHAWRTSWSTSRVVPGHPSPS